MDNAHQSRAPRTFYWSDAQIRETCSSTPLCFPMFRWSLAGYNGTQHGLPHRGSAGKASPKRSCRYTTSQLHPLPQSIPTSPRTPSTKTTSPKLQPKLHKPIHTHLTMGGDCYRTAPTMTRDYPQRAAGPVGKQIHSIYQGRLKQFTDGGQYRAQSLIG